MTARLRALFGGPGSLQRKLTANVVLALLAVVLMASAIMIYEFLEHLEERLDQALTREAKEVLIQVDPEMPDYGLDANSLRFRGPAGAYRYTVFGAQNTPIAGSEDTPAIRSALATAPLGQPVPVALPGERKGIGLCGITLGQRICVLATANAPFSDSTILSGFAHDIREQGKWVLLGAIIVLATALLTARWSLRPLRRTLTEARDISPNTPEKRLSTRHLPLEIRTLVESVNQAFDRLEHGYLAQRAFSANVAHEVRTPLAILHSSVERLEDSEVRENLKNDLKDLENIFEQLIDLARADALNPEAFEPVDLCEIAVQVSEAHALYAVKSGRTLAVTGAKGVCVPGHKGLIYIALDNLVRNALTHAPNGTEVEICIQDAPPGFRVLDRGPGIAKDERTALFQRFRRGKNAVDGGSGLGLAIVKSVADAHGAQVRIDGRPGGGSVFVLEFQLGGNNREKSRLA